MSYFLETIEKIVTDNKGKKIAVFVDMDGVIAEYRISEGEGIRGNIAGTFLGKRPVKTTIEILKEIKNNHIPLMYVLSSCLFEDQAKEKTEWLDKHASFFDKDSRLFVVADSAEKRRNGKIDSIEKEFDEKKINLAILIDDTHEILFKAIDKFGDRIIPFHVSSLIE